MDEPPAATPPDTVLLTTKFTLPGLRPDRLERPRLLAHLEQATHHSIVLVSTPAGFGKTILLADWARISSLPVAWLSLDMEDNDPARFWRYVAAALERACPGIGSSALDLLQASAQPTLAAVVTTLVNALAADSAERVLVLDDYHLIEAHSIHDSLAFLLEHLPPEMHLVISSRSDPPLPLARWRARGRLAELRANDLRFSLEETVALLRHVWGLDLPEGAPAALAERTEGWVTGLQLAALSLRGATDPAHLIQEFTGSHRFVLDYLSEEVLKQQSGEVREFMLATSVLAQLCGPLCDALTGRTDSQQMLADLEGANLFLVPLDEQRRWYRYHQLFASLLLARLKAEDGGRVAELHRRAAGWYEAQSMPGAALRHALAAGEMDWAARLVEGEVEALLRRGEGETLRSRLAALPAEVVGAHPRLALAQAIAAFNTGRLETAESFLDQAERSIAASPDEPYRSSVGLELSMLVNVPVSIALLRASLAALRGDAGQALTLVHQAQTLLPKNQAGPVISVRWNLALAEWMHGNLSAAQGIFEAILSEGQAAGQIHLVLTAGASLGRILVAQGRLDKAMRIYQQGLEFASLNAHAGALSTTVAHVGLAEVLYERNQLEAAREHAERGIALGRQLTSTQPLASGLAALAWIRRAGGDSQGARQAMEQATQVMPDAEIIALHNPVPVERLRLFLLQGDPEPVSVWLEQQGLRVGDQPDYPLELEYLLLARYLLHRKQPGPALALLERLSAAAREQARWGSLLAVQVLMALGYRAAGQVLRAMEILAQALEWAGPQGYVRTFVDEGPLMAALLHQALSRGLQSDYSARLLSAFPSGSLDGSPASAGDTFLLKDPLSERELEVLRLLAAGATNQEIADQLSIALTTARKHVSNILQKLGVHNRTQAVARGRELGLIR